MTDEPRANIAVAATRTRGGLAGWAAVAGLVAVEFLLFRHFLVREVLWAFPQNTDQVAYLQNAYESCDLLRAGGIPALLRAASREPQGAILDWQAALGFQVLGRSRMAALSINFLYFALFQIVLAGCVRWLSGRWSVAFMSLGLLLCARVPFAGAGGIADFRLDFGAFCLYGILLCLVVRSRAFASGRGSLAVGVLAAYLICFRFVTAAYLGLAFAMILVVLATSWGLARDGTGRALARRRVSGLALAAGVVIAICAPLLWSRRAAIHDYYVVGHVTGPEKQIRAITSGTDGLLSSIEFYPASLGAHLGITFFLLSGALLTLASVIRSRRTPRADAAANGAAAQPELGGRSLPAAAVIVVACLLAPCIVLTLDESKSPIVGGIMAAPVLLLVTLGLAALFSARASGRADGFAKCLPALLAGIALGIGIRSQAHAYAVDRFMSHHRADAEAVNAIADKIDLLSREEHLAHPVVFTDTTADPLGGGVMRVLACERHGRLPDLGVAVQTIFDMPDQDVFDCLAGSDFVILTTPRRPPPANDYPFNRQLIRMHPQVLEYCRRTLQEAGQYKVFGWDVVLFARRATTTSGATTRP